MIQDDNDVKRPMFITVDTSLLFKLRKTLYELYELTPKDDKNALFRYNLKKRSEFYNNLLQDGDGFLQRQLELAESQMHEHLLSLSAKRENDLSDKERKIMLRQSEHKKINEE
jgi:hypothetical protein